MRVLGLSGSLRAGSHNAKLLRAAGELLPPEAELTVFDGLKAIPPFDEDDEHTRPDAVQELIDAIAAADAVLIATPEYNHSLPGQLKNALDWVSRPITESPFKGKPTAVIGTSTGLFGAVWAQAEGRKVLAAIGAHVLDVELPVGMADSAFHHDGSLLDDTHSSALSEILSELCARCAVAA
jgi:chromate reductase